MATTTDLLLIAGGGAVGSVARFLLAVGVDGRLGQPWGTAVVNLIGCFAIGALAIFVSDARPWLKPLVLIGFLGGFTTFSAFSLQTLELLQVGAWSKAALYVGISVIGCLVAVIAGAVVSHQLVSR